VSKCVAEPESRDGAVMDKLSPYSGITFGVSKEHRMELSLDERYREIGRSALDTVGEVEGLLVVYAEIAQDTISADILYESCESVVKFRFCPTEMKELLYSFWEQWQRQPGNREWRTLCYVIDGTKFKMHLQYPDQIDEEQDVSDRRPSVVKKYFGEEPVDYSNP
jgi:hypothetical protein